jgi:outer membrane protein assembly factor BamB
MDLKNYMFKKQPIFHAIHYCLLLVCLNAFSQTEVYKSDLLFTDFQSKELSSSLLISGNKILFSANNYKIYAIDKDSFKPIWETYIAWKSNTPAYLYKDTFLYGHYENETTKVVQYDLNTGAKIKKLPFESIKPKPYFVNNIMYCTVLADGGKLVAYHLDENKIIWQKNIGHGIDFQPVYLKDKIIVNAEDDNWFEIDYNGNFLKTKSKSHTYIDSVTVFVKKYKFLTHDGKEITQDFLKKNKLSDSEYLIKTSDSHTFILTEKQLLVLENNRKKVLQLDLETEFPTDNFEPDAYSAILETHPESIWFCCQNYLVHYDLINNKRLRKVDLTKWNPHQVVLDNRTIWLISKNDGQLYGLDFEPDERTAAEIEARAKMEYERLRCPAPDLKKIEAAKAAQEKFRNKE